MWVIWMTTLALAGDAPQWSVLGAAEGWTEVATRTTDFGEVAVLHRKIGELHCLQGVATTTVPPDVLVAVAADIPSALAWSTAGLTESRTLKQENAGLDFYQLLDVPDWTLVTDRYWVLHGEREAVGEGGVRFRWTRLDAASAYPKVHEALSTSGRALEIPANWGEWLFTPGEAGTDIRYRVCTDSGGALPQWLQKVAAQRTLPDTVADLVREAGRRATK